ncbi:MAG: amidophosphoribosyltransferase [Gammaproteobacteria bacterium]|nr:amidophosphoribosyltransferase [Gammaproteobacteria bacterium]
MCGITGIVSKSNVNQAIYDSLTMLQHRGQDAAGMVTSDGQRLFLRKNNGMVRDVFHTRHMLDLKGHMGIGHARYPTAGCSSSAEAQPFYVNSPYGITLAHNGNLTNGEELSRDLKNADLRHLNTGSDSEILLNILAHELQKLGKPREILTSSDIFEAVTRLHQRCRGGYAAVAMITGVGILGFRDPFGIRPVVFGERSTESGKEYMIASETVAINALGFTVIRDIAPGEAVFISADGELQTQNCAKKARYAPCIFEHVYLARPDSIIDDISVYKTRLRMGETLANKIKREWPDHDIDVVIPIPETGRTSALPLAFELGVKYREGFIKNRYIPRTFIMPGQSIRKKSVRQKLNAIELEFKDKNVLLVDDSIVRGTTSGEIVQMARESGANKVYFASAAPPVRYPNVYGIDMPTVEELIAHNRTEEEVADIIGADKLIYQDLNDLVEAAKAGNSQVSEFDTSCFTGDYVTGDISSDYLDRVSIARNEAAKMVREMSEESLIDLSIAETSN